ncbi:aminotransferase class V-fold PLP-dependent enzyme [Atopobiaceae bacterium 24-176]
MIYLNCAATSHDRPACVADAVLEAMGGLGSSGRGAGAAELGAARTVARARDVLARLLGAAAPERVVFTANATEALNIAILGCVRPGDSVVATDWDHNSVLRPLYRLERTQGVRLSFWRADRQGRLDLADLERLCAPGTRLVVVTHGSNLTGNLVDVAACAEVAHAAGALLLVDCSQTAGSVPFSMEEAGADLVAFTGHKALLGPQGTGGLIVAPGVEVEPVLSGGTGVASSLSHQPDAYPEHLEAGTLNGHGIAGLAAAAEWLADKGVDTVHAHDLDLVRRFVAGLRSIPGVTVYGDFPDDLACLDGVRADHGAVVSMNLDGWDSSEVADELDEVYGIAVRAGLHCAPRMHGALGTSRTGAVRFSFGAFTAADDVDAALAALTAMAAEGD